MPEFFAFSIIVMLFSVIVHEVMHGLVALKFGDRTAQKMGRLTLNPIPHIDLFGTILLPGFILLSAFLTGAPIGPLLAWAKPVPVNPLNFSNIKRGEFFVSAAGIFSNFALAILAAIIFRTLNALPQTFPFIIGAILQFTVRINLVLGLFNLLPIPPLDGSKMLMSQLPYNLAKEYQKLEKYGFLILLFLVFVFPSVLFSILGFFVSFLTKLLLGF